MFQLRGISKGFGADLLFSDVSWQVQGRDRVGLVGDNGTGKSTLLKLLAGLESPDEGQIQKARESTLGYLPQDCLVHTGRTLYAEVRAARDDLLAMKATIRQLDWRIWARTDRYFIRQFEAETDLELLVLLDATASMAWRWKESISKLEYGANLLAALAAMHIRQQDRVGFLMHDAENLHYLPPRGRKQQLDEIFAILTNVKPAMTQTFPLLVQSLTENKHHRGRVIICSDLEEDEDQILSAMEKLASLDDEVILFHILDYAEEIFMFEDATHLQDAESGELLAINLEAMRAEHADNVRGFRDFWRLRCQDWNILYIPIHTGMNYAESIIGFGEERKLSPQSSRGSS